MHTGQCTCRKFHRCHCPGGKYPRMPRGKTPYYPYHPVFPVQKQHIQRHSHKKHVNRIAAGENHGIHRLCKTPADHSPQPHGPALCRYRRMCQTLCCSCIIDHDIKQYTFSDKKASFFHLFTGKTTTLSDRYFFMLYPLCCQLFQCRIMAVARTWNPSGSRIRVSSRALVVSTQTIR